MYYSDGIISIYNLYKCYANSLHHNQLLFLLVLSKLK